MKYRTLYARVDPKLLLQGGGNPWGRGAQPTILVFFSEKPYQIKEILVCRGGTRFTPLNLPLICYSSLERAESPLLIHEVTSVAEPGDCSVREGVVFINLLKFTGE